MATSNDRLRARYGICLSDSCQKCKDKTVQIITGRKDFVCEECGKPLREVPRPQTAWEKNGKKIIGGIAALAIAGGATAFFVLGGDKDKTPKEQPKQEQTAEKTDTAKTDTVAKPVEVAEKPETPKAEEPKVEEPKAKEKPKTVETKTSKPANGPIRLG